MKRILIFLFVLITSFVVRGNLLWAQSETIREPQTYALLIGISDYEDPAINSLKYAHRDAQIFAEYLRSSSGGNVPEKNIMLLQNEQATWSAVYTAMDEISSRCQAGDRVFFYFSGHGDVESDKIYKLGFLIAYNTPHVNFINSALRLEDLNNFANTLSTEKNVQVILITDACHSGNLSGTDFRGPTLIAEQLRFIVQNEVRLSSCKPDELSMENEKWGGGRSVFSYYLIQGLQGLAESNQDGQVDVKEIDGYLHKSLGNDPVLKKESLKQTPVVLGNEQLALFKVSSAKPLSDSIQSRWDLGLDTLSALTNQSTDAFFKLLSNPKDERAEPILLSLPFDSLKDKEPEVIPELLLKATLRYLEKNSGSSVYAKMYQDLQSLQQEIIKNPNASKRFCKQLVIHISNYAQQIISLYQQGDEQELEKRRYYNSFKSTYQTYANMLAVARKCSEPSGRIQTNLLTQQHYFQAVAYRLLNYTSTNPDSVLALAEMELNEAIKQEEYAAYLYQELGHLNLFQKNIPRAEANFKMAEAIAPRWSLPKAYLGAVAILKQDYPTAQRSIQEALTIQPELNSALIHAGMLQEEFKNYLSAQEYYHHAIEENSRHYLPYERLGWVCLKTANYVLADSFFYEAEKRKQGYHFLSNFDSPHEMPADVLGLGELLINCNLPNPIPPSDLLSNMFAASFAWRQKDTNQAIFYFLRCLKIDPHNHIANHYYGLILWARQQWTEATYFLEQARKFYISYESMNAYAQKYLEYTNSEFHTCFLDHFPGLNYNQKDDEYLLADAYTQWHYYDQAIQIYKNEIRLVPTYLGPYYKLWTLYESLGRWEEAEKIVNSFYQENRNAGDYKYEREAFYLRVLRKKPKDPVWYYKAGLFENEQVNVQFDPFYKVGLGNPLIKTPEELGVYKTYRVEEKWLGEDTLPLKKVQLIEVPGTKEKLKLAFKPQDITTRAIYHLDKLTSMSTDVSMSTHAYQVIGSLYQKLGATITAQSYFQKALNLHADYADVRNWLVQNLQGNNRYYQALLYQDTLWRKKELRFEDMPQYVYGSVMAHHMNTAEEVFEWRKLHFPLEDSAIQPAAAFYSFMNEETKLAIRQFEKLLQKEPENLNYYLILADLNLLNDHRNEAYQYLKKAMEHGFKGYWVLKYNPAWKEERKTKRYQQLIANIQPEPFE